MKPELFIFDLDGTLVNSLADLTWSVNTALQERGLEPYHEEEIRMMVGNGIRKLIERSLNGRGFHNGEEIDNILKSFTKIYREHCLDRTLPYHNIKQTLLGLKGKGIKIAVLSNKADEMAKQIVTSLFGKSFFDLVRGMADGMPAKPEPSSALWICSSLGVLPASCCMVGDSGVDIQTARRAGFFSIGVTWGFRSREELEQSGAQWAVDKPEQLLQLV